ncbi:MAG: ABC transporter permease [Thermoanaerobaculia bacterium]
MKRSAANVAAVFRREMASYFLSPIAYVVVCIFVFVNGLLFYGNAYASRKFPQQIDFILRALYGWAPFWCLFLCPIITMRLFAEEKRTGTLETLMTAPVTGAQVVAGKFLAAEAFFLLIWGSLLLHVLMLAILGNPDLGPVAAVYIALAALGAAMNGLGLLASALTRNQIIAVIGAFAGGLLLLLVEMARQLFPADPEADRFFDFVAVTSHFENEYYRGVVDLRFIALYLALAAVLLFLTSRAVEARRWR